MSFALLFTFFFFDFFTSRPLNLMKIIAMSTKDYRLYSNRTS